MMGTIKSIDNGEYGNMTITDGENDFYIYGVFGQDGRKYQDLENRPVVRDIIYVRGLIKKFHESIELNNSTLIKMEKGEIPEFNIEDYEEVTLAEAHQKDVDSKVLVEGVVAQITKQTGNKANGVFIVDETEALYVYDSNIASSVEIGDRIVVAGKRVNFILGSEVGFAERFGYEGAIQIDEANLVSHTQDDEPINLDWVEETSIKELMDTDPRDENITGTIFKVKAFIHKVPGNGFTNYYFNDLDDQTGSYTYTMNNGNDFAWLDQYDGELREVYLSVLNAKSTVSAIIYRFLPIKIGDVYEYDEAFNPEYVVKFHGVDQFDATYTHPFSPEKEVVTVVNAEHLGLENIELNYSSSNEDVARFVEVDGKLIFRTDQVGKATIMVEGIDGDYTFTSSVEIEVVEGEDVSIIDVKTALDTEDKTEVYVEGIVGASLVNKVGFFLIDETGIIAVEMSATELDKVNLGNKVIIKGIKDHAGKRFDDETEEMYSIGHHAILQAEVIVNMQGNYKYPTDSFNGGTKTIQELLNLDDRLIDYSSIVYHVEARVVREETPFYTRYQLEDDLGNYYLIYSSSANQLRFLDQFRGEKVTVEFNLINWNGKRWTGSILAVLTDDGKVVNNSNFR